MTSIRLALPATVLAMTITSAAAAADGRVEVATRAAEAGHAARLGVDAGGFGNCALRFSGPAGARTGPFLAKPPSRYVLWTWRIPRSVRPGAWRATVGCDQRRVASHTFRVRARNGKQGTDTFVARGSVRVSYSSRPFGAAAQIRSAGDYAGDPGPQSPDESSVPPADGSPSAATLAWDEQFGGGGGSVPPASAMLGAGESLGSGDDRHSPNGEYRLLMQADGNLVLYFRTRDVWSTHTNGHSGARASMQSDGNLVVYAADGAALWNSGSAGHAGARLDVQDDANVVIYAQDGSATWSSNSSNSKLLAGERLTAGEQLYSANRQYVLTLQADGNLVLSTQGGRAIWDAHTAGHPGADAEMQSDGNLVVYSSSRQALWSIPTQLHGGGQVVVQNDGNVVAYTPGNQPYWASNSVNSWLVAGDRLLPGQSAYSPNGAYELLMQSDGNLVLYSASGALWSTRTAGHAGASALMQSDGNLVVYATSGQALWSIPTQLHSGGRVLVQSDGNLVAYTSGGQAYWASGTAGAGNLPPVGDDYAGYKNVYFSGCGTDPWADQWGFCHAQCTSFVAWRMNRDGGAGSFTNGMGGSGMFGNAGDWARRAQTLHDRGYANIRVDHTPTVGAVAHWDYDEVGGGHGHVAYVGRVNADGTVVLEEYNYLHGLAYDSRTVAGASVPRYIHINH
jgi:surface antigen